jgi:hypothetical protein
MMIPSQWERRLRPAIVVAQPLATAQIPPNRPTGDLPPPRAVPRERPGWARAALFGAMLLGATWVMLWLSAAAR